ncbi:MULTISPECIES: hypothetical protein [unclassified Microcoleus]|uniref:hypothetical protein n=1 Tax=unclassified Microcoleus TaxID=2642155 RepID=UPI002FD2CC02
MCNFTLNWYDSTDESGSWKLGVKYFACQQSTVNSQQSTVNSQQSTVNNHFPRATGIDITSYRSKFNSQKPV